MQDGVYLIVNGLCSLIGALLIWKITHNFYGWAVLFFPGSTLVLIGLARVFRS